MILNNIFSSYELDKERAIEYGFTKIDEDKFVLSIDVENNLFIKYTINNNKNIEINVLDKDTLDEYVLFNNEDIFEGLAFCLKEKALMQVSKMLKLCFKKTGIKDSIIKYIEKNFNAKPEYLWEDDDTCIFRNKKKKWFAIIMNITWDKLKLNSKEQVSVMNIKLDPNKIKSLIDNKVFFECYHMNKKHWISIALTNKLDLNEIEKLIEESYNLTC
ncbi:MAG: MmcQ/YjbR family DNA-binding protein [Christensenella sp.]|nr:MmcQ/YjbR family DNA-binding protein [Christensenella sp.]